MFVFFLYTLSLPKCTVMLQVGLWNSCAFVSSLRAVNMIEVSISSVMFNLTGLL